MGYGYGIFKILPAAPVWARVETPVWASKGDEQMYPWPLQRFRNISCGHQAMKMDSKFSVLSVSTYHAYPPSFLAFTASIFLNVVELSLPWLRLFRNWINNFNLQNLHDIC